MVKPDQSGAVNALVISLIIAVILLLGVMGFAGWAFNSRQDYKNHVDAKISAAVVIAKKQQGAADKQTYDQAAKNPLATYNSPEPFGSLVVLYPKTWSAYINDTGSSTALVDGYFAPGHVPALNGGASVFALRIQVLQAPYPNVAATFGDGEKHGKITATPYALPKLPKIVGMKLVGQLPNKPSTTTLVVLPLRSDTLEIWAQGTQYLDDFNNIILPNFSFSP